MHNIILLYYEQLVLCTYNVGLDDGLTETGLNTLLSI